MRNWELAETALGWRQTASSYRGTRNAVEVPDPLQSAFRLEHLASQLEAMIEDREEPPIKSRLINIRADLAPPPPRKFYKQRKTREP